MTLVKQCQVSCTIPFPSTRCKPGDPYRNPWRPNRYLPSCILLAQERTCGGWRIAAVSRWWSWYTAAQSRWTVFCWYKAMQEAINITFFPPSSPPPSREFPDAEEQKQSAKVSIKLISWIQASFIFLFPPFSYNWVSSQEWKSESVNLNRRYFEIDTVISLFFHYCCIT